MGKPLPLSQKISETRTRGSITTPHLVLRLGTNGLLTDWRPPNPVEHRWILVISVEHDSALRILLQVLGGRGSSFGAAEKAGAINPPFKNSAKCQPFVSIFFIFYITFFCILCILCILPSDSCLTHPHSPRTSWICLLPLHTIYRDKMAARF